MFTVNVSEIKKSVLLSIVVILNVLFQRMGLFCINGLIFYNQELCLLLKNVFFLRKERKGDCMQMHKYR